jgi:DDE superfamily endonuclease
VLHTALLDHSLDRKKPLSLLAVGKNQKLENLAPLNMLRKVLRDLVVSRLRDGRSVPEIFPFFKNVCTIRILYLIDPENRKKALKKAKKRKQPPRRKVTPNMVCRMVRLLTEARAYYSSRFVAKLLAGSEGTIRYHMKYREINSYKKTTRNLLPQTHKENRRKCCMRVRKTFHKDNVPNILFADECYIVVGKYFDHQNERCYGYSLEVIPDEKTLMQLPKTSLCAMVFGAVFLGGRTPLTVLKSDFMLNRFIYRDECLIPMQENLPECFDPKTSIFWHDKASCPITGSVQDHLKENFPHFVPASKIPTKSPDLNPIEFSIRILKKRVDRHRLIPNFEKLKKILEK